ncbi:hypothetical protein [Clostridium thermarum]|uniref:hypothetical protein n=1 Tax=Clostridium thermarum TaxID=1716543 RepID=UPI0013D4EA8D|nr:hypothetical protein [Clostridium thermarum]
MDKVNDVTEENLINAIQYKKGVPEHSVRQIIQIMELEGVIKTGEIKQSTLSRLTRKHFSSVEYQNDAIWTMVRYIQARG